MVEESRPRFDLFVSYAEADRAWVEGYLRPALGLPAGHLITARNFQPGASVVSEFDRAVVSSRFTLLVLSPAFLVDEWATFGEQLASYASVAEQRERLIPLLLEPCELPLHLEFRVRLDCTDEANWESEVARLRALLNRPEPEAERIPCPYPGMAPFTEAEADRFFGREQVVQEMIERLRLHPFLAVIGPSGSGKSSLLQAGLIPHLEQSRLFPAEGWRILNLRPGSQPIQRLAAALSQHLPDTGAQIAAELAKEPGSLCRYLSAVVTAEPANRHCLLLVDQFEEVFAQCKEAEQRQLFLASLHHVAQAMPERCLLVLSIRADFYGDCQESLLWPHIQAGLLNLPPLSPDELRRAIVQPAQAAGVYLEPALVERLIADAADEKGVLPLLQETLVLLWSRFLRRRLLTLTDYTALGSDGRSGLQVALSRRADATLAGLVGDREREIARRIFLRLVEFGERRTNTRRQQPVQALHAEADPATTFQQVLEYLIQHRLLTTSADVASGAVLVDLAHEKLIEAWSRLGDWLESYQAMEEMRRSLELAAIAWQENGRDASYLFTGNRLERARAWAAEWSQELGQLERAFLEASQAHARRQRLRQIAALASITAVALLLLAWLGWLGYRAWLPGDTASELAFIAGGPALVGSDDPYAEEEEGRLRTVELLPFRIEKYEVSNRQYRRCVENGPCSKPARDDAYQDKELREYPVVEITPEQAQVYCRWLGGRLPTTIEWERAARGAEGRPWPWGDSPPRPGQVQMLLSDYPDYEPEQPLPVVSMAEGATPEGIHHLVGNVREWVVIVDPACQGAACHQAWDGKADTIAWRGGGYDSYLERITEYQQTHRQDSDASIGFRCVFPAKKGEGP